MVLPLPVLLAVELDAAEPWLYALTAAFALAHTVLRMGEWRRVATGGPAPTAQEAMLAVFEAVLGVVAAGLVAAAAVYTSAPGRWFVFAALVVMTLACIVSVVVARRASKHGVSTSARSPHDAVVVALSALDERARQGVGGDLASALDRLVESGVIDPDAREAALRAPLGGLARRMWALERAASHAPRR